MQKSAVVALALLESASAFQAPAMKVSTRAVGATMFAEGDTGVTPPLGVYDPLGLIETKDMRRFEIMEIKHGRAAMLGFLHIVLIHAGVRLPGYLSIVQDLKFSDMPVGCLASLEATPTLGWLQIMAVTCAAETGYAGTDSGLVSQADDKAPGDIGGAKWKRYSDPAERAFKLNAERNNGRAAMLGVTGCIIHELLGVDALFPTGGMGGAAPPAIL
jgi:light-harvesting complex I chlorophyll a/b binding protein 1